MRIHIVCPSDEVNGSAESLHQFGRAAAILGYDVRIAYLPDSDALGAVPSAFRSYGLRNDQDLVDEPGTVVLVPHAAVELVAHVRNAQKLVWWLRLDEESDAVESALATAGAVHLAQSEYARAFLEARGVNARLIGDYVHARFIERAASLTPIERLDVVLYNPDPRDELTPHLIEASQGVLAWVPVSGLSSDEVAEIMAYSKLYVDFGTHTGRTRMPREALAAGCCVVAGKRGAAGNGVDLVLPDGFSFDDADPNIITDVLNRLALTVMEFDEASSVFATAADTVGAQEDGVRSDIAALLAVAGGLVETIEAPAALVGAWLPGH